MLKAFQRLGYFPHPDFIPTKIITHIRSCLKLPQKISAIAPLRSRRRYQDAIRGYLKVTPYNKRGQQLVAKAVAAAAQSKDHPADLINVAIEELVKERYELPAFSTLERLTLHIRSVVNNRLFAAVARQMSPAQLSYLEQLLSDDVSEEQATLDDLKAFPKSPSLSQITRLQAKFEQLMTFGDVKYLLSSLTPSKLKHFAAYARSLDASELGELKLSKRRTLLLCLLYQSQVKTRDHLVEIFLKRIKTIHNRGKEKLQELRERHRATTEALLEVLGEILEVADDSPDEATLGRQVRSVVSAGGGTEYLRHQCEEIAAYNSDNYLPLLWQFYCRYRAILFQLVKSLEIRSTTQDQSLLEAIAFLLNSEQRRGKWLPADVSLNFASQQWQKLIFIEHDGTTVFERRPFEVCVFSYLATELKSGDLCVDGSEGFADYREQLLTWEECQSQVEDYCDELGFKTSAADFVEQLRTQLTQLAVEVDQICQDGNQITISQNGQPVLRRIAAEETSQVAAALETAIYQQMPERSVLDILSNVEYWLNWTRHFGHVSGSEPKLDNPTERYLLTVFGYGCNLGPNQMARHTRGRVSSHQLSYTNRRHVTAKNLEAAIREIINAYNCFNLPKFWGTGKRAAADGTKFDIYENNLVAEYHIRYGGYGGIAYHHVSDTYIALFTHFITCGVWEAVYILDGLLKNTSDIQPDTLHADTQGQSAPVFALAHLLGIKLMPRIRNWSDYSFYRPSQDATYEYIDPLFRGVVNWKLIETHWQDLMQVVLSIRAGKLMPSTLLRKLGTYSRKNRLYQAFRELGRVVRTIFLLQYISDTGLRRQITECTNKVEAYNGFSAWLFFGKEGVITENDPLEQEKRIKYLDLVANAVILQNTFDMSSAIRALSAEGYVIKPRMLAALSPYLTQHIKRYGDYVVELGNIPQPLKGAMILPVEDESPFE